MDKRVKNEARRAQLAGRPCLHQYSTPADSEGLIDKKAYQRMYEAKWGGAPWLNEHRDTVGEKAEDVIVIDMAPPPCPEAAPSITPSSPPSSTITTAVSSRRTTMEDGYESPSTLARG